MRARSFALRLVSEALGGASVQDRRWARSPPNRAVGLRASASQKTVTNTARASTSSLRKRGDAICSRKSKSRSFQWPGRRGMGRRGREATTVPARRGGAAATGTGGFSSSLGLGWGVALRAAAAAAAAAGGSPPSSVSCRWGPPQQLPLSTFRSPPKFTCGSVWIPSSWRGTGRAALGSLSVGCSSTREFCLALFLSQAVCQCVRESKSVYGVGSVNVECERAGVGGFGSPMNPLSRNAAKRNAPRTRAGLVTRVPVPPGQAEHDARELSCRL